MRTPFSAPAVIQHKTMHNAPSRTVSENWGRQGGFFGDEDLTTSGYKSVLIYVRKGLGHFDVIKPVVDFVMAVQYDLQAKWPLIPLSFCKEEELNHLGTGFGMGYVNDWLNRSHIAKAICKLAGQELEEGPSLIRKIFPKTDMRSLYTGKVAVKADDLLVFVDFDDELYFDQKLKRYLRVVGRKHMIFVGVDRAIQGSTWKIGANNIRFAEEERHV